MTTIDIGIHKTDEASSSLLEDASSALYDHLDPVIFADLSIEHESTHHNMNNSYIGSGDTEDRKDSVKFAESALELQGQLGDYDCHVIIYEKTINETNTDGAGFANWVIGAHHSDDIDHNHFVEERRYDDAGKYALSFVNESSGYWPFDLFEQTVIHEVAHNLDAQHQEGSIWDLGDAHATPMATWQVESDCGVLWPDRTLDNACEDEVGDGKACDHTPFYSGCVDTKMNGTINDFIN